MQKSLIVLVVLCFSSASANAQTFDFESQPSGAFASVVSTEGGVTLTATSTDSGSFVHANNPGSFLSTSMGNRALIGALTPTLAVDQFTPVRMDFSSLLTSLSLLAGDGGGDDDGTVRIRAYNSLNVLIDTDTALHPSGALIPLTLSVAAPGISYIIADSFGGPNNLNSVFWDNVTVVAVPEPGTIGLLAVVGILSSPILRRRNRS